MRPMSAYVLSQIFSSHCDPQPAPALSLGEATERALEAGWETGRAVWPEAIVSAPLFVQHLAERIGLFADEETLLTTLAQLHLSDLYLTCACAHGSEPALRYFERTFMRQVPSFLVRLRLQPSFVEDVAQELHLRLFVVHESTEFRAPGIAAYTGRGRLVNWLRAVAVRRAIDMLRIKDEQHERDGNIAERITAVSDDPVLDGLKRRFGAEFKHTLEECLSALPPDQRNLLRHYYVKGFTTTELGALFNLNQSNVSRRLSSIRESLLFETQRRLRARLKLSESDFSELAHLVQSQLNLSLSRILK